MHLSLLPSPPPTARKKNQTERQTMRPNQHGWSYFKETEWLPDQWRPDCHWMGKHIYKKRSNSPGSFLKEARGHWVERWPGLAWRFSCCRKSCLPGLCPQHWTLAACLSSSPLPSESPSDYPLAAPGEGPAERMCWPGARGLCPVHSAAVSPTVCLYLAVWDAPLSGALVTSSSPRSGGPSGHADRSYFGAREAEEVDPGMRCPRWGHATGRLWSHLLRQRPIPPLA